MKVVCALQGVQDREMVNSSEMTLPYLGVPVCASLSQSQEPELVIVSVPEGPPPAIMTTLSAYLRLLDFEGSGDTPEVILTTHEAIQQTRSAMMPDTRALLAVTRKAGTGTALVTLISSQNLARISLAGKEQMRTAKLPP